MFNKKSLALWFLGFGLLLLGLLGAETAAPAIAGAAAANQPSAARTISATVAISPSKDNTLYQDLAGGLSNGAGSFLFAGRSFQASNSIKRGLIHFDVAGHLHPDVTITGVTLRLHMSKSEADSEPVALHRLLADWGEGASQASGEEGGGAPASPGDATWLHRFSPSTLWTTPGGDFDPTASASTMVDGIGPYTWSSAAMLADVQAWLSAPASNHGWLLRGNEATQPTAKRFNSRSHPVPSSRPALLVTFEFEAPHAVFLPSVRR